MREQDRRIHTDMSSWVAGITVGVMAGMACSAWTGASANMSGFLVLVAGIIGFSLFPDRRRLFLWLLSAVAFWSGLLWYGHVFDRWQTLPEQVAFTGTVEIIERGVSKIYYRPMLVRSVDSDWSGGDILYRAPIDIETIPGERWNFSCLLKRPENFTEGFDYRNMLAGRGTGYVCERGGTMVAESDGGMNVRTRLYQFQSGFRAHIASLVPEPEAGLLSGLLIGGSDTLAKETKDAFARVGLSHIVAVSGYNMSVVAEGLVIFALALGFWRRFAVVLAALGLVGFLLIIDGSAASLRAALMAWLAFGAYFVGRPAASWNGLLIAGTSMLVFNPLLIRHDVGFQLSFLATLALLVFARSYESFSFFRHWYGKGVALLLITVIIEIFTFPIIVSTFGTVSLVAPIANMLILPLVPLTMFIGIAAVFIAAIVPSLGLLFAPFVWAPLMAIIRLVEWMARLPWANMSGLDITPIYAVCWYASLGLIVYWLEKRRKRYVLEMDH